MSERRSEGKYEPRRFISDVLGRVVLREGQKVYLMVKVFDKITICSEYILAKYTDTVSSTGSRVIRQTTLARTTNTFYDYSSLNAPVP